MAGKGRVAAVLVGLLLLALPATAGKIRRYTDSDGTLHIIDSETGERPQAAPGPGVAPPQPFPMPPTFPIPGVQPPPEPEPPEEGVTPPEETPPPEQEVAPESPEGEPGKAAFQFRANTEVLLAHGGRR
jgi:hypothetical protein